MLTKWVADNEVWKNRTGLDQLGRSWHTKQRQKGARHCYCHSTELKADPLTQRTISFGFPLIFCRIFNHQGGSHFKGEVSLFLRDHISCQLMISPYLMVTGLWPSGLGACCSLLQLMLTARATVPRGQALWVIFQCWPRDLDVPITQKKEPFLNCTVNLSQGPHSLTPLHTSYKVIKWQRCGITQRKWLHTHFSLQTSN